MTRREVKTLNAEPEWTNKRDVLQMEHRTWVDLDHLPMGPAANSATSNLDTSSSQTSDTAIYNADDSN